jgi:hypothetical protein
MEPFVRNYSDELHPGWCGKGAHAITATRWTPTNWLDTGSSTSKHNSMASLNSLIIYMPPFSENHYLFFPLFIIPAKVRTPSSATAECGAAPARWAERRRWKQVP